MYQISLLYHSTILDLMLGTAEVYKLMKYQVHQFFGLAFTGFEVGGPSFGCPFNC